MDHVSYGVFTGGASDGNDFHIFGGIAVDGGIKFSFALLEFWFEI